MGRAKDVVRHNNTGGLFMKKIIDRFEEDFAVVVLANGTMVKRKNEYTWLK